MTSSPSGIDSVPCTYWKWAKSWLFSAISWHDVEIENSRSSGAVHAGSSISGTTGSSKNGSPSVRWCHAQMAPPRSIVG